MNFFHDLSIRNKLVGIMVIATVFTMGAGFSFVIKTEIDAFKQDMVNNTLMNARILGEYCVTPLDFDQKKGAEEILARMQTIPSIEDVLLFDETGDLFAAYSRSGEDFTVLYKDGTRAVGFESGYLHVSQPIFYDGERYGLIYIRSTTDELGHKIRDYITMMSLLIIVLVFLSYFIAHFLQRIISNPILDLAKITKTISEKADYSARVTRKGFDEVGILYDEFNKMLDQIETREEERDEAVSALDAEKDRLKVTLRAIGDAVVATDTASNIVLMNKVAEELTGWFQAESIGRRLDEILSLIHVKTREPRENPAEQALESGVTTRVAQNTILISKNGDERHISGSSAPISDEKGEIIGVIFVFRDITDLKIMQERLLRHEKLAVLGQLSGSVGHELRNPLGAIRNAAYFLKMVLRDSPDKVKEHLEILEKQVLSADEIISNLLDFSRIKEPDMVSVPVQSLVERALIESAIPPVVDIIAETPSDLGEITVDPTQINLVLMNLIQNSVQAMPDGGALTVAAEKDGENITISVVDTGCGIAPKNLDKIFEPLFTTKVKGFGFGMAICKNLVETNQGEIDVESEVEKGTTVRVRLPIAL